MKNSSQTQYRKSETKRKEEQKIEENEAGSNGIVANMMNSAENFATRWNFRYHSEFSLCSENFASS